MTLTRTLALAIAAAFLATTAVPTFAQSPMPAEKMEKTADRMDQKAEDKAATMEKKADDKAEKKAAKKPAKKVAKKPTAKKSDKTMKKDDAAATDKK